MCRHSRRSGLLTFPAAPPSPTLKFSIISCLIVVFFGGFFEEMNETILLVFFLLQLLMLWVLFLCVLLFLCSGIMPLAQRFGGQGVVLELLDTRTQVFPAVTQFIVFQTQKLSKSRSLPFIFTNHNNNSEFQVRATRRRTSVSEHLKGFSKLKASHVC